MTTILEQIVQTKREEVAAGKVAVPVEQLRETIVTLAERRSGQRIDRTTGLTFQDNNSPYGQVHSLFGLFGEDPIFERALMHQPMLALVTLVVKVTLEWRTRREIEEAARLRTQGGIV